MKVLHIIGKMNNAGVQSVVFSYLRAADLADLQVHVAYDADSTGSVPADLSERGIVFLKIPSYSHPVGYVREISRICRENKYDIVHSHMNSLSSLSLFGAKLGKVPHRIAHSHTTSSREEGLRHFVKNALRPLCRAVATEYVACSRLAGEWLFGKGECEKGNVRFLNNGIDPMHFSYDAEKRRAVREEYRLGDSFVIGHVGRLCKTKNQRFLIPVLAECLKGGLDCRLLLVGDGDTAEVIKRDAETFGVSDRVVFAGVLRDTAAVYSAMDVFVLPSLYEGLPVVSLEAQAADLPTLLSDRITVECRVTDKAVFLPITDGARPWVSAIEKSVGDRREGASPLLGTKFDISVSCGELFELYRDVLTDDGRHE